MIYTKQNILKHEDMVQAANISKQLQWKQCYQYYNLFNVEKADVPNKMFSSSCFVALEQHNNMELIAAYFLKYVPGSFCRLHADRGAQQTIVTLIEQHNLVGGYSLVKDVYDNNNRRSDHVCKRSEQETNNPPYGRPIIDDIVPMEVGDSLIYGSDVRHGVSKVHQGYRTVLITWFNNRENR